MDNFQNNNMNNENQQNSFSYNYGQNDTVNATGHVVEEKPKKKKKVFKRVIAFAVCAAVISAGSIQAYRYIDDNFSFENFFSRGSSSSESVDDSSSSAAGSASTASNKNTEQKSLIELASREGSLSVPEAVSKVMPAVVGISSEFPVSGSNSSQNWFFGGQGGDQNNTQTATATGTGIVMTSEGYIVTNAHVIYDSENGYGKIQILPF